MSQLAGPAGSEGEQTELFTLVNATRGWLDAVIVPAQSWFSVSPTRTWLLGQQAQPVTVTLHSDQIPLRGQLTGQVNVSVRTVVDPSRVEQVGAEQVTVLARASVWRTMVRRYAPSLRRGAIAVARWLGSLVLAFAAALLAHYLLGQVADEQGWEPINFLLLLGLGGGVATTAGALLGGWKRPTFGVVGLLTAFGVAGVGIVALPYSYHVSGWDLEHEVRRFFLERGVPNEFSWSVGPALLAALPATLALHAGLRRGLGALVSAIWGYGWALLFAGAARPPFSGRSR